MVAIKQLCIILIWYIMIKYDIVNIIYVGIILCKLIYYDTI